MNAALNPLFITSVSVGLIFIITSIIVKRFPPQKINRIYGYRTKNSMSSQQQWDFAQRYSNNLMQKFGFMLVLLGGLAYFTNLSDNVSIIIAIIATITVSIAIFVKTEQAIKDKFGPLP